MMFGDSIVDVETSTRTKICLSMECPHLDECVTDVKSTLNRLRQHRGGCQWQCEECKTNKSPWVCLTCGMIHCGRYVNGHSKSHFEENSNHCVCMDCDNWAVFCYSCDDFAVNDTQCGLIGDIREYFSDVKSSENKSSAKENRIRKNSSSGPPEKKIKMSQSAKPKASGLRNLGNTCFMNAVLQSLRNCLSMVLHMACAQIDDSSVIDDFAAVLHFVIHHDFVALNIQYFYGYIRQLPSFEQKLTKKMNTRNGRDKDDVFVVEELRKTICALWQGGKGSIAPDALFSAIWKVVPRFRGYQQQDAHEFMRYLLDRLHTELLTLLPYPETDSQFIGAKSKSSIVTNIFGGLLQSEVQCLVCGSNSKKMDPFLDISLDIPAKFASSAASTSSSSDAPSTSGPSTSGGKAAAPHCTLTDCLSSFTALEELEESELYMCTHCKQRRRSTKRFWIKRLPKVLCLHLKRFRWGAYQRMKIDTHVEFPLRGLDVSKFVLNGHGTRHSGVVSSDYDLAAVIVHHGSGAGCGHYTSYAIQEGQWHHFNDSKVSLCDEQPVLNSKAYILFYVKRHSQLPLNGVHA